MLRPEGVSAARLDQECESPFLKSGLLGLWGVEENAGFDAGFDLKIGVGHEEFDAKQAASGVDDGVDHADVRFESAGR